MKTHPRTATCQQGTTLIEVLIALVIVTVGLLGVAKMQALAISSSRTSSLRSLIAIEAASMASAMQANEAYWQTYLINNALTSFSASVSYSGTTPTVTITATDTGLTDSTNCSTTVCTAQQLAAYDINTWALSLWNLTQTVGSSTVSQPTINCVGPNPMTCTVEIQWTENTIGINATTAAAAGTTNAVAYNLVVQP
jgi:type IV pilus assembly protein PilV